MGRGLGQPGYAESLFSHFLAFMQTDDLVFSPAPPVSANAEARAQEISNLPDEAGAADIPVHASEIPQWIPPPAAGSEHRFQFTGSGKEYFRIWIVNLCLTVATLGIYSAWAKVRRLQYFDRNTRLAGAVFDFHGDPKAILKGRLVALVLLAAYHYAFGFSQTFGIVVLSLLFVTLPWMMRSALRFRTRNTSYRGLRFGFAGSVAGAYAVYLPVLLLFFLPGALSLLYPEKTKWVLTAFSLYLAWPLLHALTRRYQHRSLVYGASRTSYTASVWRFLPPYLIACLWGLLAVIAAVLSAVAFGFGARAAVRIAGGHGDMNDIAVMATMFVTGILTSYLMYLAMVPYLQVRIYNLVWTHTRFPTLKIRSELRVWPYIRLQAANTLLTVLTLGLFRPFAVVRAYRYRLEHMAVLADSDFEEMLNGEQGSSGGAAGDGAAEFLGFDLSW
jgi:uncharacterized membrane protein YjgN (DUF898 family)